MFVLIAIAASAVFYTGKAGPAWVATNASEAFAYSSAEEAARVARNFNRNTLLHGLTFNVERAK